MLFIESFFTFLRYLHFCPGFFGYVCKRLDKEIFQEKFRRPGDHRPKYFMVQ